MDGGDRYGEERRSNRGMERWFDRILQRVEWGLYRGAQLLGDRLKDGEGAGEVLIDDEDAEGVGEGTQLPGDCRLDQI